MLLIAEYFTLIIIREPIKVTNSPSTQEELPDCTTEELRALLSVADAVAGGTELDEILHLVVTCASRICRADHAAIGIVEGDFLVFDYQVGIAGSRTDRIPLSRGITGWVASNNRRQNLTNAKDDPRFFDHLPQFTINSELVVPISVQEKVFGVIDVESLNRDAFGKKHEDFLIELCKRAAAAIVASSLQGAEHKAIKAEIAHLRILQDLEVRLNERLLDLDAVLNTILDAAMTAVHADTGQFLLFEDHHLNIRVFRGGMHEDVSRRLPINGRGITVLCFRKRSAILVADIQDTQWRDV